MLRLVSLRDDPLGCVSRSLRFGMADKKCYVRIGFVETCCDEADRLGRVQPCKDVWGSVMADGMS